MRALRRYPATVVLFGLVVLVGILTAGNSATAQRHLQNRIGMDLDALRAVHIWGIPVATFVQSSPGVEWHMLLLVALPLIALEFLAGSLRTLACFLLCDWLTAPLVVLVLWALSGLGSGAAALMVHEPDTGSSAAAHGVIACALMLVPPRLATFGLTVLIGISLAALTFERLDAAVAHLLGITAGMVIGLIYRHRSAPEQVPMPA